MPRPVLVVDFDGTIGPRVNRMTKDALLAWRGAGGIVVLNTARPLEAVEALFPDVGTYAHRVVSSNGTEVTDLRGHAFGLSEPIPDDLRRALQAYRPAWQSARHMFFCGFGSAGDRVAASMRRTLRAYERERGMAFRVVEGDSTLNVMPAGVDKLTGQTAALEDLREHGIDAGITIGVGDSAGDLRFLTACDLSVGVDQGFNLSGLTDFTAAARAGAGVVQVIAALLGDGRPPFTELPLTVDEAERRLGGALVVNLPPSVQRLRRGRAGRLRQRSERILPGMLAAGAPAAAGPHGRPHPTGVLW